MCYSSVCLVRIRCEWRHWWRNVCVCWWFISNRSTSRDTPAAAAMGALLRWAEVMGGLLTFN